MNTTPSALHEDFHRDAAGETSSDRAFGLVFAGAFGLLAVVPVFSSRPVRWWAVAIAAAFFTFAMFAPRLLKPLNRAWARIGAWLHRIVSPIALLVLFAGFVVVGWASRRRVRNALGLAFDANLGTYWMNRDPPGPAPASMRHQF